MVIIHAVQHTVDRLQTIGVYHHRIFVYDRPYIFFNQPDDLKKHQGVSEKHQGRFSLLLLII